MKKFYKRILSFLKRLPWKMEVLKTTVAEWVAIFRKAPLYKNVKWTSEQQSAFDVYWKKYYGKKISNRWHRLYEACNGVHCIEYLPEWLYSVKMEPKWNDYAYTTIFSDKNLLGLLLDNRVEGVRTPRIYLCNSNGRFYDVDRRLLSEEKAAEVFGELGEVVIKPSVDSSSGHGVAILNMKNGVNQRDGRTAAEILKFYKKNFCVQEKIILHKELSALYPNAVNTFRVISYTVGDRVETAPLSMRIGGGGSEVDNIHAGGMSIYVKPDGKLCEYAYRLGYGDSFVKFAEHPDTKIKFDGYAISFIDKMVAAAKQLHLYVSNVGIISWDFTVDENGCIVVIEMNLKGQSVWFPQMLSGEPLFGENTTAVLQQHHWNKK